NNTKSGTEVAILYDDDWVVGDGIRDLKFCKISYSKLIRTIMNSTSKNNAEKSINLLDILKYLLFHWRWFLVSILICGGYYLYQYATTPFMYVQSETVMIKTPMNTPTTARITRTNA